MTEAVVVFSLKVVVLEPHPLMAPQAQHPLIHQGSRWLGVFLRIA